MLLRGHKLAAFSGTIWYPILGISRVREHSLSSVAAESGVAVVDFRAISTERGYNRQRVQKRK